ncbi:stalk domain-containing protein [Paenibacillus lignilyticus]|uniref:PQQ-binding-like beta-propeller repeat protein n=1 Tax=Paenibacillus lignilyticus TaxID=1172615 RepID=A0ABS5C5L9_9BACL|nr:stalk domain-containing protein [Paenibacillus lignilyticus]MBP3961140.1 PQQ-binding-like beta-propeller repeat protein [Paenibacillus lignilyticus]
MYDHSLFSRKVGGIFIAIILLLGTLLIPGEEAAGDASGNDPFIRQEWNIAVPGYIGNLKMSSHGLLYVISSEDHEAGTLYAITKDGKIVWKRYLPLASRTPTIDDSTKRIYVADGALRALDAATGELLWSFAPPNDTTTGVPTVDHDVIFTVSNLTGTVYAVDRNGKLLWKDQITEAGVLSPVAVSDSGITVVLRTVLRVEVDAKDPLAYQIYQEDGSTKSFVDISTLHAFDQDGFPLWRTELRGMGVLREAPLAIDGGFAIGGEAFYIVSDNGQVLYKPETISPSNPGQTRLIDGVLYYPSGNQIETFDMTGKRLTTLHTGGVAGNAVKDSAGRIVFWQEFGRILMVNQDGSWRILLTPDSGYPSGSLVLDEDGTYFTVYSGQSSSHIMAFKDTSVKQPQANNGLKLLLDGQPLRLTTEPVVARGRLYLPMRELFTALGATVNYDVRSKTITAKRGSTVITLTIGKLQAVVNGRSVTLDAPGKLLNGHMMIPLRFVGESFGYTVSWDQDEQTIQIAS